MTKANNVICGYVLHNVELVWYGKNTFTFTINKHQAELLRIINREMK